jgi:hypothetical protein
MAHATPAIRRALWLYLSTQKERHCMFSLRQWATRVLQSAGNKARKTRSRSNSDRRIRLRLDLLEDRTLLSTFFVSLSGSDLNTGDQAHPFRSLQAAVTAAAMFNDGNDIIRMQSGTYNDPAHDLAVVIPLSPNLQNLQILGGYDASFTTRTPRSTIYIPQQLTGAGGSTYDVQVNNPSTTIDGIHWVFDGTLGAGGTRESGGTLPNAKGLVLTNNEIEVGVSHPTSGFPRSTGLQAASTDQTGLTITGNTFDFEAFNNPLGDFFDPSTGIFLNPDTVRTTPAVISGNTFSGSRMGSAIIVDTTGLVTIMNNTITRTQTGNSPFDLIGLRARSVATPMNGVTITGNTLDSNNRAQSSGIQLADAGGTQAISGVTITNNILSNNPVAVVVGPGTGFQTQAITATIRYNAFINSSTDALFVTPLGSGGSDMIDATRNWWGAVSGPTTASNPGGMGGGINSTAGVTFAPWLIYAPVIDPSIPGFQLPATVTVTPGGDVSPADNDFRRLQNAIGAAATGQTIDISGTFDWTATNASASYTASTSDSANNDTRGIKIPAGVDNLTITSSAANGHILGKGDFDTIFSTFVFADDSATTPGNTSLTIENLNIDHFKSAILLGGNSTGVFNGTKVLNNTIKLAGNNFGAQNIGIYLWMGLNQQVMGNTINFEANGTRVSGSFGARSFGFQDGTTGGTGYNGLMITGNTFQVLPSATANETVNGIWENGHNDDNNSHITIAHNTFLGITGGHLFDRALIPSSQTTNLVLDSNTFTDVHYVYFGSLDQGLSAGNHFTYTNNVLTRVGGSDGIFLQNVTDDATPIHIGIIWNINNTVDGETGVRGLNELSIQATHESRPSGAATDLSAVTAVGPNPTVFVSAAWAGAARFTNPAGIGSGVGPVAFGFNGFTGIQVGINAVDAGGTVNVVGAGTYPENLTISKNLTLTGVAAMPPTVVVHPASGDGITITSPATMVTVQNLQVTGAANGVNASGVGTVSLQNLTLTGNSTGLVASNLTTLNLSDLTLTGNSAAGGTISQIGTVNDTLTTGSTGVSVTINPTSIQRGSDQALNYSLVGALNATGGNGADTFNVTPSPDTPFGLDGGLPASAPGDMLVFNAMNLPVFTSLGNYTAAGRKPMLISNFETINLNNAASVSSFYGPDTADRATALAGLTPQERFVQVLYLNALGRAGSKAELDGWVAVLNGPGGSQAAVASGIERSFEARDHLVRTWYQTFLGRTPGGGEELGLVNQLTHGQTEETVLSDILGGPEFHARAQTLVNSGTPDERFVQALYLLLLNRTGSSSEIDAWVNLLPTLGAGGVAHAILTSGEFRTYLVEAYYEVLLHRPGDATNRNTWVTSGMDATSIRVAFESGPEFFSNG